MGRRARPQTITNNHIKSGAMSLLMLPRAGSVRRISPNSPVQCVVSFGGGSRRGHHVRGDAAHQKLRIFSV